MYSRAYRGEHKEASKTQLLWVWSKRGQNWPYLRFLSRAWEGGSTLQSGTEDLLRVKILPVTSGFWWDSEWQLQ
jgi:hypothetical protein